MSRILASCFLILAFQTAQGRTSEKSLFSEGIELYQQENFDAARDRFENLVENFKSSKKITTYQLMLFKTLFRTGELNKSIHESLLFLDRYPNSRYTDFARFNVASCLFKQNQHVSSARIFLDLSVSARHDQLRSKAISISRDMMNHVLSLEEISLLKGLVLSPPVFEILTLKMAEKCAQANQKNKGVEILEDFVKGFPESPYRQQAETLLQFIKTRPSGSINVGVVLSLTGDNSRYGKALKQGIELAADEYNEKAIQKIELIIRDDESTVIEAIKKVRDLINNENLACVVGPLESNAAAAAGIVADISGVPLVSPTATRSGLTELGKHIYQANPDFQTRFRILGEYAVKKLNLKTFAVLAPDDEYGKIAVNSFGNAVTKNGGKLIAVERYIYGTQNFESQFESIRKLGFIFEKTGKVDDLYGLTTKEVDALYEEVVKDDNFEDVDKPLTSIDALFVPLYTDEIKYIGPQIAFYNLESAILGGDHWYDEQELKLVANYVNGLVFVSEFFLDAAVKPGKSFKERFGGGPGEAPVEEIPREVYYGYDTMKLLIQGFKSGYISASKLQAWLGSRPVHKGLHNTISIGEDRVNKAIHVLRYSDQEVRKID